MPTLADESFEGEFMSKLTVSVLAGAAMLCLASADANALKVNHAQYTLENGMQVVVIPDHRAPVVTHMVWYKVGSADEVSGKTGLAHFFEHLMFKGTAKHPPGDFDRLLSINGGDGNAFTSQDYTAYFQRIAADRLALVMELEADRMHNLKLNDDVVATELQVVKEERRQRTDSDPAALLSEQADAALYIAHPYGRPVVGWMSEVAKLTTQDAVEFYKAHYTPANAILVVAGDVEPEAVKKLADEHYGKLKNSFVPKSRVRTQEPAPIAARRVEMKDPRVTSLTMQRSYLGPSYHSSPIREVHASALLADILGNGSQSRLYRKLVVEQKIAAYAGAWFNGTSRDSGTLGVYAAPVPGKTNAEVEKAVDEILAEVLKNGVTQEELDRARKRSDAEDIYALDDTTALARLAGVALATEVPFDTLLDANDEAAKVTVDDVKAAAAKYLQIKASVTSTLEPEKLATN